MKKAPAANNPANFPLPNGQMPPGFKLPPGVKLPPNFKMPPGMKFPPAGNFPMMPPQGMPAAIPGGMKPPIGGNFMPPQGFAFNPLKKAELPKDLVPALIDSLKDKEKDVRQFAASSLVKIGKDAVTPLVDLLESKDKSQRANAAYVLGQMGAVAREDALPLLIKALKDDAREVRIRAAFAIDRMVASAQNTMPNMPTMMMNAMARPTEKTKVTVPADPGTVPPSGEPIKKPEKEKPKKADKEK